MERYERPPHPNSPTNHLTSQDTDPPDPHTHKRKRDKVISEMKVEDEAEGNNDGGRKKEEYIN